MLNRHAFSGKSQGIQHQNTLHFAPKRTAFCTKTHCIQRHIALHLAANSPRNGANGDCFKLIFILPHAHTNPIQHQNKPSRESIFCDEVSGWFRKRALIMLKSLPKTRHSLVGRRQAQQVGWGSLACCSRLVLFAQAFQLFQVIQIFQVIQVLQLFQILQLFQVLQVLQLFQVIQLH